MRLLITVALILLTAPVPYFGTSGSDNIWPMSPVSAIYSSPGRDYLYLQSTDTATYYITDPSHVSIATWPRTHGGTCVDGRYTQIHWFDASTDRIDLSSLGHIPREAIHWLPAPQPNYLYHYLVVDLDDDSCSLLAGVAFRSDRFLGAFDIDRNVITAGQPFSIDLEPQRPQNPQSPQDPDQPITVYTIAGQQIYRGEPSAMRLQPGTYLARNQSKGWHLIRVAP